MPSLFLRKALIAKVLIITKIRATIHAVLPEYLKILESQGLG